MSKCALMMKYRNAPSLWPDENRVAIEDERCIGEKFAQALPVTKEWLACRDREALVSDEDNLAAECRRVRKDSIKQLCLGVKARSAIVLLPARNNAAPGYSA